MTYSYAGLPAGCTSADTPVLACTPNATGTFNVQVTVTDANGMTMRSNATLTVNASFLGLPAAEGYAVVAGMVVLAAVVVVLAVLLLRRPKKGGPAAAPPPS